MMTTAPPASVTRHKAEGLVQRVWSSLHDSIGEIVFGMEDGTVSIFGLVFGLAAAAPDASTVLVAGATGAAAAAVSMMAGTFLDVESARDQRERKLQIHASGSAVTLAPSRAQSIHGSPRWASPK